jgi:hypothetical protein
MTLKLFRAVWFLSVLLLLADLLYVYASLPEMVRVQENENLSIDREWFFYLVMISIVVINVLVYLFKVMFAEGEGENARSWFHGLVITINIFLIVSMQAINVYNSREIFDYSRITFFLTGSLGLIVGWAALWPLHLLYQKFFLKEAV